MIQTLEYVLAVIEGREYESFVTSFRLAGWPVLHRDLFIAVGVLFVDQSIQYWTYLYCHRVVSERLYRLPIT